MIRLICFDLGGVLVQIRSSWRDACAAAGVALPAAMSDGSITEQLGGLAREATIGRVNADQLFERTRAVTGLSLQQVRAISSAMLIEPYAGVPDLIDDLLVAGRPTACLSNTHDHHWRLLTENAGPYTWMNRLAYRFASHRIGCAKPEPAIYRHVEDATGAHGSEVLFFDDLPAHCAAAAQLGWQTHCINAADDPVRQIRCVLADRGLLTALV